MTPITVTVKCAADLAVGDQILNLGHVEARGDDVGVFVVVRVCNLEPSLATGRIDARRGDVTFHCADDVYVAIPSA